MYGVIHAGYIFFTNRQLRAESRRVCSVSGSMNMNEYDNPLMPVKLLDIAFDLARNDKRSGGSLTLVRIRTNGPVPMSMAAPAVEKEFPSEA